MRARDARLPVADALGEALRGVLRAQLILLPAGLRGLEDSRSRARHAAFVLLLVPLEHFAELLVNKASSVLSHRENYLVQIPRPDRLAPLHRGPLPRLSVHAG